MAELYRFITSDGVVVMVYVDSRAGTHYLRVADVLSSFESLSWLYQLVTHATLFQTSHNVPLDSPN